MRSGRNPVLLLMAGLLLVVDVACPIDDDDVTQADDDSTDADDDLSDDDTTFTDDDSSDDDDTTEPVDMDGDGWTVADGDCDDEDPDVHPGQDETVCDGVDNDCDVTTLDDPDQDGDGYDACEDCDDTRIDVNPGQEEEVCDSIDNDCDPGTEDQPDLDGDGFHGCGEDCDDSDPLIHPDLFEVPCDGQDNDCDPTTVDSPDGDGDGYGRCEDCDDDDIAVNPGATEQCNGIDDDCDGALDPQEADDDHDMWMLCEGDCDGGSMWVYPGAEEACDGVDTDCDGVVPGDETTDVDGDGALACEDCHDMDPAIHPGATEVCDNGVDDDCDGGIDDIDPDCGCATIEPLIGNITVTEPAVAEAFCEQYNAVYGDLILDGAGLVDTSELQCLCEVTGSLTADTLPNLQRLSFPLLTSIGGDIYIHDNLLLEEMVFPELTSIGGFFDLAYSFPVLQQVEFPRLEGVGSDIYFFGSEASDISFAMLETVGGSLTVRMNEATERIAFPALSSVGVGLECTFNTAATISFPVLLSVPGGDVFIYGNSTETGVLFNSLLLISGELYVNDRLTVLWMPALEEVHELDFVRFTTLSSTVTLPELRTVHGPFTIEGIDSWPQTYVFPALTSIGSDLKLGDSYVNPHLEEVEAPVLEAVSGDVLVGNNDDIERIDWESLVQIGGSLAIAYNDELADILSLYGLESVAGDIVVSYNGVLPEQQAWYLADVIGVQNIGGGVTIVGNAP